MAQELSATQDAARLSDRCSDFADTEVLISVGSTNQYLLDQEFSGSSRPKFVWTHEQTRGRGRRGRSWVGAPQHSLMFSMQFCRELRPHAGPEVQQPLSGLPIAVGVALAESLHQYAPELRLKWPNDLQRAGRKFGGILIETRHRAVPAVGDAVLQMTRPRQFEQVVIGVGLNLHVEPAWEQSIGQPVCGLFDTAIYPLRATIAEQVARTLNDAWLEFQVHGVKVFVSRWQGWDALLGLAVRVLDGERVLLEGVAAGLTSVGTLLVRTETGQQEVSFGDVSVRSGRPANSPDPKRGAN